MFSVSEVLLSTLYVSLVWAAARVSRWMSWWWAWAAFSWSAFSSSPSLAWAASADTGSQFCWPDVQCPGLRPQPRWEIPGGRYRDLWFRTLTTTVFTSVRWLTSSNTHRNCSRIILPASKKIWGGASSNVFLSRTEPEDINQLKPFCVEATSLWAN